MKRNKIINRKKMTWIMILLALAVWVGVMCSRPRTIRCDKGESQMQDVPLAYEGNRIDNYVEFRPMLNDLIFDIDNAQHYVLVELFKFEDDRVGRELAEALSAKAEEGVAVYVLYDDISNLANKRMFKEMSDRGVHIAGYGKIHLPFVWKRDNYRNHRKIAVVDGQVGFLGGMNVADRYEEGLEWGPWRDTFIRINGRSVAALQQCFSEDWEYANGRKMKCALIRPDDEDYGTHRVEIVASGPIGKGPLIMEKMVEIINSSQRYIFMESPYFIPTKEVFDALNGAARRGVDVRILLPPRGDRGILPPMATNSNVEKALLSGIKIGFYDGYMHSKLMVCDDSVSSVGSTNIDPRSLVIDQEINAFVYGAEYAKKIRTIFTADEQRSRYVDLSEWGRRPAMKKLIEKITKIVANQL